MSDIRTVYSGMTGDFLLEKADLSTDNSLQTAVLISLFTDRRALADDEIPDNSTDPRGWWGNAFINQSEIGSRLWLLKREKQTQEVVQKAKEYIEEALSWLVSEGIAEKIHILVEKHTDRLAMKVEIYKPEGNVANFKYNYLWQTGEYENGV